MKHLILVRGISGSGKSTLASALTLDGGYMVAADDFMVDNNGNYKFDPKRLKEVHEKAQYMVREYLAFPNATVVVHNTFTQKWEMQPYIDMANNVGAKVTIVSTHGVFGNVHDVGPEVVNKQLARWETVFLHEYGRKYYLSEDPIWGD